MDRFRNRRITDEEIDKFYPMGEVMFYEWLNEMDHDGDSYEHWLGTLNGLKKDE